LKKHTKLSLLSAKTILPFFKSVPNGPAMQQLYAIRRTMEREEIKGMYLPVDLLDGRLTTSYTLRDPRGSRRVFRKSNREATRTREDCHLLSSF